jgi:hypothetical protein
MDNLEKIFTSLPKSKLGVLADFKIRFKLYRLITLGYLKNIFVFNFRHSLLSRGLIAAVVVFAIFSATAIFAYANNNIVPGDKIYPLKIAVEKLEQKITANKTAKIAVYEKMSVRRLKEAVNLSAENLSSNSENKSNQEKVTENINKNINEVVDNHQSVVNSINNLDNYDKAVEAVHKARDIDKMKTDYLNKIADYAQSNKDEKTLEKVVQAQEVIDNQKYKYKDQELNNDSAPSPEQPKADSRNNEDIKKPAQYQELETSQKVETSIKSIENSQNSDNHDQQNKDPEKGNKDGNSQEKYIDKNRE